MGENKIHIEGTDQNIRSPESCNGFSTIRKASGINCTDVKSKETSSSNVMIEPQEQIFLSDLCCWPPTLGRGYTFQRADRHYYILCFIHPCSAGLQ